MRIHTIPLTGQRALCLFGESKLEGNIAIFALSFVLISVSGKVLAPQRVVWLLMKVVEVSVIPKSTGN